MKIFIFISLFLFIGCSKQIDRLLGYGNGETKKETFAKYPWLDPSMNKSYTPEFCSSHPQICHDEGIPGY